MKELTSIFIIGTIFGSFLNVCIERIPRNQSVVSGRSRCPNCAHRVLWRHNVPLLSYLLLRGRCAWCRRGISLRYPFVELLTGLTVATLYGRYGPTGNFASYLVLTLLLIVVAGIDLKTMRIPNILLVCGLALWVAVSPWEPGDLASALLGSLVGGGTLLLVGVLGAAVFKKETMGGGDVKLGLLIGLFLGTDGVLLALGLAVLLGGGVGAVGLITGVLNRSSKLPFGMFLAIGTFLYLTMGHGLTSFLVFSLVGEQ